MPNTIAQFDQYAYEHADLPDIVIGVTEVPHGLPVDHPVREDFDDRSLNVGHGLGTVWFRIVTSNQGAVVAVAVFGGDGQAVQCDMIEVEADWRRQGIATLLYQLASKIFAAPVVPSNTRTPAAIAFWGGRTQITV